jgi:YVTN family beta-propeller protein
MYVANYYNDSISLIDVNTDIVTDTITGIRTPGSIAYNPIDNSMYVTNFDSDSVTVIDDTSVKQTIPGVGDGPYAIAFNPANEKMYVTNEKENSVTIIGRL